MEVQMAKWSELNQTTADSVKKSSTIKKNLLMNLTQQQMDIMGIYMEGGVKQIQLLTKSRDVKSALSAQADLVQEFTKKLSNNFRVTFEIAMDARTELSNLYQSNVKVFTDQWLTLSEQWAQNAQLMSTRASYLSKPVVTITVSESPAPKLITATAEVVQETVKEVEQAVHATVTEVEASTQKSVEAIEAIQEMVTEEVEKVAAASTKTVAEKATSIKAATKTSVNRGRNNRKPPVSKA